MKHQILTEFVSILQSYIHELILRVAKQGTYSFDFSIFWSNFVIYPKKFNTKTMVYNTTKLRGKHNPVAL